MTGLGGRIAISVAISFALVAPLALGATATGSTSRPAPRVDFGGSSGKYRLNFVLRSKGAGFYATEFELGCSTDAYVEANATAPVGKSGAFSYSGSATEVTGLNSEHPARIRISGKIHFGTRHTLTSAKTATVTASDSAGCLSFSGTVTGVVVYLA